MLPLLITLSFIALCTFLLGRYSFRKSSTKASSSPLPKSDCAACNMLTSACQDQCAAEEEQVEVVYFDDEELDRFAQRPSDAYSEAETDVFAEVLHTMRTEEVPQWLQSLKQRGINLPDELKEEVAFFLDCQQ